MKYFLYILLLMSVTISCKPKIDKKNVELKNLEFVKPVNKIVIAHRGTTYWAPEETEPAFRWARNIGADYLELDLQLTKDNHLVAFHDNGLQRTTNVASLFPDRKNATIHDFTLKELRSLDAGSWFNRENPMQGKESFKNQKILTLEDVLLIAEGFRIKRINKIPEKLFINGKWEGHYQHEKDPADNGNRPGVYIETKHPKLLVEKKLANELSRLGWNINTHPKRIKVQSNKVGIANTNNRIILQSFSPKSIENFEKYLPSIPKCFLLWKPEMKGDLKTVYQQAIHFALKNKVQFIGPSIAGNPNNYEELTARWMTDLIHKAKLEVHAYTFDTKQQLMEYSNRVEAVFTNRTDLALIYYNRASEQTPNQILKELGY